MHSITILKKADLEEGKKILSDVEGLAKLRIERFDIETDVLDSVKSRRLKEVKAEIIENEAKVIENLGKFEGIAKSFLEKGDKIPDFKWLESLSTLYHGLGKNDVSTEFDAKIKELKKKYNLE